MLESSVSTLPLTFLFNPPGLSDLLHFLLLLAPLSTINANMADIKNYRIASSDRPEGAFSLISGLLTLILQLRVRA